MAFDPVPAPPLELDLKRYEVRLRGTALKLERRPMELLMLLLERPGELVTRETIGHRLWGDDVFVDVNQGINTAINKIRQVLGDNADRPAFLQTIVGKGYRFVGAVRTIGGHFPVAKERRIAMAGDCVVVWENRSIPLGEGVNVIGRDSDAAVVIDSSTVSRRHAQIVVTSSGAIIEDLGSKNATRVNGHKLEGAVRLADHDVIQIGPATLTFRIASRTGSTLTAGTG
jgi:DNA-binding winged helix-turn-helix (wHTH) protein